MKNKTVLFLMLFFTSLSAMNRENIEYIALDVYDPDTSDEAAFSDEPQAIERDRIPPSPEVIHRERKKNCKRIAQISLEITPYLAFIATAGVEITRYLLHPEDPASIAESATAVSIYSLATLKSVIDLGRIIRWARHRNAHA